MTSPPTRPEHHKVGLEQHLDAVRDEETLLASVLIHSYALAETAAAERLGGDARDFGGIEDWGMRLLATTGSTWDSLNEGRAGAVEVAVGRNAYAHGGRRIDDAAANRLEAVGMTSPMRGYPVALDYPTVKSVPREAPRADEPRRSGPTTKLDPIPAARLRALRHSAARVAGCS